MSKDLTLQDIMKMPLPLDVEVTKGYLGELVVLEEDGCLSLLSLLSFGRLHTSYWEEGISAPIVGHVEGAYVMFT